MARVLEDKPGPLVAIMWTSNSDLDPPLLVCMIYVVNLMHASRRQPCNQDDAPSSLPDRSYQGFGFAFVGLLFKSICCGFPALMCARRNISMPESPTGSESPADGGREYFLIITTD